MSAKHATDEFMRNSHDFSAGKRGPVVATEGKTRVTMYLDNAVLEHFRVQAAAQGKGYQTLINDALRETVGTSAEPLTVEVLRKVLREELKVACSLKAKAR
jgi:uncharacterized protein (DUF4415 family)